MPRLQYRIQNAKKVSDDLYVIIKFSFGNLLILVPNLTKMSIHNTRLLGNTNIFDLVSSETFFIKYSNVSVSCKPRLYR